MSFLGFFEIFEFSFMRNAFFAGFFFSVVAPVIGQFMVARRLSGVADSIAHISLFAIIASLILTPQFPLYVSALITVLLSLFLDKIRRTGLIQSETMLVIGLVASLAGASILRSFFVVNTGLESLLFGSILTLRTEEILLSSVIFSTIFIIMIVFYRRFFLLSLNEDLARIQGLHVGFLNDVLIVLSAIFLVFGIRLVGALLSGAVVVIPVASGSLYGFGFRGSLMVSIILSLFGFYVGLILAWYFSLPPGASIALTNIGIFLISLIQKLIKK